MLAEKLNLAGQDQSAMSGKQLSVSNFKVAQQEYTKLFTLEFSRDRKSMSVYCKPKEGEGKPIMFVKVGVYYSTVVWNNRLSLVPRPLCEGEKEGLVSTAHAPDSNSSKIYSVIVRVGMPDQSRVQITCGYWPFSVHFSNGRSRFLPGAA